jgi:NitT/TauT family transport system permease protein
MKALKIVIPIVFGVVVLAVWEYLVHRLGVQKFVLPAPSLIACDLMHEFPKLMAATWITFRIVALAFVLAVVSGIALAILFSLSRIIELALYPYAVILQVTPVVAIAPLIVLWSGYDHVDRALLVLAWIVAFFPILSNTTLGLKSTDRNLFDLYRLYGASRWQILWRLQLPTALPYLLNGMKISGGLSLIGVIVAEFAAGTGTDTGLGWTIIESGNRLHVETMFAALAILSMLGVAIFFALSALEWLLLHRWHESALKSQT